MSKGHQIKLFASVDRRFAPSAVQSSWLTDLLPVHACARRPATRAHRPATSPCGRDWPQKAMGHKHRHITSSLAGLFGRGAPLAVHEFCGGALQGPAGPRSQATLNASQYQRHRRTQSIEKRRKQPKSRDRPRVDFVSMVKHRRSNCRSTNGPNPAAPQTPPSPCHSCCAESQTP